MFELADVTDSDWVDKLKPFIRNRIETYQKSEQRFNLLAVVEDRKLKLEGEKLYLESQLSEARARGDESIVSSLESRMSSVLHSLEEELSRREKWRLENDRRRFNYVPFAFGLLKALSMGGHLDSLVSRARSRRSS
jgi:ubiquitin carboxyl-terminal hydrolase L5